MGGDEEPHHLSDKSKIKKKVDFSFIEPHRPHVHMIVSV